MNRQFSILMGITLLLWAVMGRLPLPKPAAE